MIRRLTEEAHAEMLTELNYMSEQQQAAIRNLNEVPLEQIDERQRHYERKYRSIFNAITSRFLANYATH